MRGVRGNRHRLDQVSPYSASNGKVGSPDPFPTTVSVKEQVVTSASRDSSLGLVITPEDSGSSRLMIVTGSRRRPLAKVADGWLQRLARLTGMHSELCRSSLYASSSSIASEQVCS